MKQLPESAFFKLKNSSVKKNTAKNQKPQEFDFVEAIRSLGKDSIDQIKKGSFDQFDPLVSDWSCQLRTIWFISLLRKFFASKAFTEKDYEILGIYSLLTMSKVDEYDAFGISLDQFTDLKFKTPGWEAISNRKNVAALGTAKKELSAHIVNDLRSRVEASNIPYKQSILERFKDETFTTYSEIPIRFIEFFPGYLTVLELAIEDDIPITVALSQFVTDKDKQYCFNGARTLFFKPKDGKFVLSEPSEKDKTLPCIAISMYSGLNLSVKSDSLGNQKKTDVLLQTNFDNFVNNFKTFDLKDVILTIAATHPQFTSQVFLKKEDRRLPISKVVHQDELSELRDAYQYEGIENQIGIESYYFNSKHFSKNIPINIKHVFVSTFKLVAKELEERFESVKNQKHAFNLNEPHEATSTGPKMN